jgi:glycosyltransferase involved in cell wall biosynthesis
VSTARPIALFIPTLKGGGAERMMIQLGAALADRGHTVDLVVGRPTGTYFDQVPRNLRLVMLQPAGKAIRQQIPANIQLLELRSRTTLAAVPSFLRLPRHWRQLFPLFLSSYGQRLLRMIPALTEYLRGQQPTVLLSALTRANVVAVVGKLLSSETTRIVVSERNHLSRAAANSDQLFVKRGDLARHFYPLADACVGVSEGVADDLSDLIGLPREKIIAVKNPVVTAELASLARESVDHPWFTAGAAPVVLAVGRLTAQKDYPTLLRAVERVRRSRPIHLLILGSGPERESLIHLAKTLQLDDVVEFHGFAENPYAFMARASLFVLSSAWEGSPNALVEAMACGCPVLSTNCPSGPAEILDDARYGKLVPVGDSDALARGIAELLDNPTDAARLREGAARYSSVASAEHFERVLGISAPNPQPPDNNHAAATEHRAP